MRGGAPTLVRAAAVAALAVAKAAATFIHAGDETIGSVVIDGAGVDWDASGIKRLAQLSRQRITAPIPQTFCSRADPFC